MEDMFTSFSLLGSSGKVGMVDVAQTLIHIHTIGVKHLHTHTHTFMHAFRINKQEQRHTFHHLCMQVHTHKHRLSVFTQSGWLQRQRVELRVLIPFKAPWCCTL